MTQIVVLHSRNLQLLQLVIRFRETKGPLLFYPYCRILIVVVEQRRIVRGFAPGAILGFIALVGAIQFIRPARTNPPVIEARTLEKTVPVPSDVERVLARACQDCHSDLTHWPWYSKVAPISWYVVDHVIDGRRDMNFSEWLRPDVKDPVEYTLQKFHTACREIRLGHMPLYSYLLLHPAARLAPEDVDIICGWAETGLPRH